MNRLSSVPPSTEVQATSDMVEELLCLPGRGLTLTELLRALDLLRRRLARSTRGREGAFAGFDALDVSGWNAGAEEGSILFSARLVSDEPSFQVVDYAATRCVHAAGTCLQSASSQSYVVASGRTVGLSRARALPPATGRFLIPSPHR